MARTSHKHPAQVTLGERIRAHRAKLGISQMVLAERIGLHFSFVSETERGMRNLSLSSLLVIAEGLEINPAVLVDGLTWNATPSVPADA